MSFNTQAAELTWDWWGITMDHANESHWLLLSGVMCTCDHEELIEDSSWCKLHKGGANSWEDALPHKTGTRYSFIHHIIIARIKLLKILWKGIKSHKIEKFNRPFLCTTETGKNQRDLFIFRKINCGRTEYNPLL